MNTKKTDVEILRTLFATSIGNEVLNYVDTLDEHQLKISADSQALELLSEIKEILNDQTLKDPDCFRRIDAIIRAYEDRGMMLPWHRP